MKEELDDKLVEYIEAFIQDDDNMDIFMEEAEKAGLDTIDPDKVRDAMIDAEKDPPTFISKRVEELFYDWQIIRSLLDAEPYATILKDHPEKRDSIIRLARKVLDGEPITEKELFSLFEGE